MSDFELLIYWDLQAHTPSLGLTKRENIQQAAAVGRKMPCWCQWARLAGDQRKATGTWITTDYNHNGTQNTTCCSSWFNCKVHIVKLPVALFYYFFSISIKDEKLNNFLKQIWTRDVEEGVNQSWESQSYSMWIHSEKPTPSTYKYSRRIPWLFPFPLPAETFFSLSLSAEQMILLLDSCQLFWAFVSAMWTKSCPWRRSLKEFLPSGYNYLTPLLVPELEMSCFPRAAASSF